MPSSPFATTGTPGAATASGTPLGTAGALGQLNSVDWLSNAGKTALIQQWKEEAQTQIKLVAQADAYWVNHAAYDSAVAALSTNLIAAGAPANWATTWPDGTNWNVTGIMNSLTTWWTTIATARAALMQAINGAIYAVAASALAHAPSIVSNHTAVTLPSTNYPPGCLVLQTVDNTLWQVDNSGTGWLTPAMQTSALIGTLVAGQIGAGIIGADALAAVIALIGDIRSSSPVYAAGTSAAAPVGFRLSGQTFTTTYLGGATDANCQLEIGGSANFGGYKVQTVVDKVMNNTATLTGSGNWTCPPGITQVEVTIIGPGGAGARNASGGGAGGAGGTIKALIAVTPGSTYAYSVGTGGAGTTGAGGNGSGNTTMFSMTAYAGNGSATTAGGASGGYDAGFGYVAGLTGGTAGNPGANETPTLSAAIIMASKGASGAGSGGTGGACGPIQGGQVNVNAIGGSGASSAYARGGTAIWNNANPLSAHAKGYGAGGAGTDTVCSQGGNGGNGAIILRW